MKRIRVYKKHLFLQSVFVATASNFCRNVRFRSKDSSKVDIRNTSCIDRRFPGLEIERKKANIVHE